MVKQDLNKYVAPKYRLVARITNSKIVAQIVYAQLVGDKVLCEANSSEFKQWGLTTGLTSYAAAYATGLLLGRRLLTQLKMDKLYSGNEEIDGKPYNVGTNPNDERKPFMAILDIGIRRPTVGNRVFAVMKGACDAGVHVPHNVKKFPGFEKLEDKKTTYNAEVHRDRIFGCHIDEYMEKFEETETNKQFKKWKQVLKAAGVESVEDMFEKIHKNIFENPARAKKTKRVKKKTKYEDARKTIVVTEGGKKYLRCRRLTYAERKAALNKKISMIKKVLGEE
jgi:large subunit ribosomal protein L5e